MFSVTAARPREILLQWPGGRGDIGGKPVLLQLIPGQLWGSSPCQLTGPESACGLTQAASQSASVGTEERNVTPRLPLFCSWRQRQSSQGQTFLRWPIIAR